MPSTRRRALVALTLAALTTTLVWVGQAPPASIASDWLNIWVGARAMAHGHSPYPAADSAFRAGTLVAPLYYPATATAIAAPLGLLSARGSAALWAGLSVGLLAFALTRAHWWRLGALASMPTLGAVLLGQWSPALTAAASLPWLGFLWAAKPNIGLALAVGYPSRRALLGITAVLAVSLAVVPTWPLEWLATIRGTPQYLAPWQRPFGWLLLLAWLRWRTPEGRMLGSLALLPHTTNLYEMVPLLLIPRRPWELAALWLGTAAAHTLTVLPPATKDAPAVAAAFLAANWATYLWLCYLPALLLVLRSWELSKEPGTD